MKIEILGYLNLNEMGGFVNHLWILEANSRKDRLIDQSLIPIFSVRVLTFSS